MANVGFWINALSIVFIIIALFVTLLAEDKGREYFAIPAFLGFTMLIIGSIICFQKTYLVY